MLAKVGQVGRVGLVAAAGATNGYAVEHFNVLNAQGAALTVPLECTTFNAQVIALKRWVENASDAHFLLTPGYVVGSMTLLTRNGSQVILTEPVEVSNIANAHFYIPKVVLGSDRSMYQVIV